MRSVSTRFFAMTIMLMAAVVTQAQSFETVKSKNLEGDKFAFPADLDAPKLNIVMLAISEDQDNGTWQGEALLEWYALLEAQGVLSDDVKAWHFSVMKVPFFIKGVIRSSMADDYEGKLPLDQAAPLYVKDAKKFAAAADVTVDDKPTVVLMTPDGQLHESFKGEPTEALLAQVASAVSVYVAPAE